MKQDLLKKYVEINQKYADITAMRESLREEIVKDMRKNKMEKVETDFGSFTVATKTNWTYTKAVEAIKEKLKIAQVKEQQKGLAKPSETQYLVYKEPNLE